MSLTHERRNRGTRTILKFESSIDPLPSKINLRVPTAFGLEKYLNV
jgi:hypothetical protein